LRRGADFERVYREGRFHHSGILTMHVLRVERNEPARVGVVAGKKIGTLAKRSVWKRRVREAIRLRWATLPPGVDLIFVLRPAILQADYRRIDAAVGELLRGAGVLVG
jgi:ribonuclease P protein component